jgi:sugar-specific transcriptional regulator TrmB
MSVDEQQVQSLMELGLNSYEAKAYLALMGRDSFTAPQVADRSGVPRQRVYDVLNSLVEQGLAIGRPGKRGVKYTAVAPDIALTFLPEAWLRRYYRNIRQGWKKTNLLITLRSCVEANPSINAFRKFKSRRKMKF